jgi:hypothetical protein
MKRSLIWFVAISVILGIAAEAKPKKPTVPEIFKNATYVYVEAYEGDEHDPGIFQDDRQAIYNVEDALQKWNRYHLTRERREAELVLVVRKGAVAKAGIPVVVGSPTRPQGKNNPFPQDPSTDSSHGTGVGAESEVGSPDDTLSVFLVSASGSRTGPIWSHNLKDGLNAPGIPLFKRLKQEVEEAYPK